jgi:hypothetical protein
VGPTEEQKYWMERGRAQEVSRREEDEEEKKMRRGEEDEDEEQDTGETPTIPPLHRALMGAPMAPNFPPSPPISPLLKKYNNYIRINNLRIQDTGLR